MRQDSVVGFKSQFLNVYTDNGEDEENHLDKNKTKAGQTPCVFY